MGADGKGVEKRDERTWTATKTVFPCFSTKQWPNDVSNYRSRLRNRLIKYKCFNAAKNSGMPKWKLSSYLWNDVTAFNSGHPGITYPATRKTISLRNDERSSIQLLDTSNVPKQKVASEKNISKLSTALIAVSLTRKIYKKARTLEMLQGS